jgi:hypothetical protein
MVKTLKYILQAHCKHNTNRVYTKLYAPDSLKMTQHEGRRRNESNWLYSYNMRIYRVFSAQADWTLTHTSHKDTEQSTIEASITVDGVTLTDSLIRWSEFAGRYQCLPIRCSGRLISMQNEHSIYQLHASIRGNTCLSPAVVYKGSHTKMSKSAMLNMAVTCI